MSTYTQILYQIVFSTKSRERVLFKENRPKLFKYIWGILEKKNCHLYRINGVEDHLHILTHIHPTVSLSNLVKDIKLASSDYIKEKQLFTNFGGWQEGYGAFTYSYSEKDRLIEYIKNQEEHHKKVSFKSDFIELLKEHGVEYKEEYLL
ncbi:MAG: IS200/IS605 family transposase [Chitinophagaceae bacterium]|nr:MAG: IS200/IS605 family transposase [Chitinophagaceae bacterium]